MSETEALLELAVRAARAGGDALLARAGEEVAVRAKSTPTDPVSQADLDSEATIRALLAAERPDDGYLGEEEQGPAKPSRSGLEWVVDPLDGTVNFLYGIPQWAVSVAVRDASGTLAGAVLDPSRGELFTASRDGGATLTGAGATRPLHGPPPRELAEALVASGLAYDARVRAAQGPVLSRLGALARDIRRFGSAALDLCWTAAGRHDAYFERTVKVWDIAAGALVCERAGLALRELTVREDLPWGILVAREELVDELYPLVDGY